MRYFTCPRSFLSPHLQLTHSRRSRFTNLRRPKSHDCGQSLKRALGDLLPDFPPSLLESFRVDHRELIGSRNTSAFVCTNVNSDRKSLYGLPYRCCRETSPEDQGTRKALVLPLEISERFSRFIGLLLKLVSMISSKGSEASNEPVRCHASDRIRRNPRGPGRQDIKPLSRRGD
jgi:hypothetical protein